MTTFVKPFRVGDVVTFKTNCSESYAQEIGVEHFICEVSLSNYSGGETFQYALTDKAWISHSQLTLVRECDAESIMVVANNGDFADETDLDLENEDEN